MPSGITVGCGLGVVFQQPVRGRTTKSLITNLHLAEEEYEVLVDKASPQTVLDMLRNSVTWE
jgi:hypothetical protein